MTLFCNRTSIESVLIIGVSLHWDRTQSVLNIVGVPLHNKHVDIVDQNSISDCTTCWEANAGICPKCLRFITDRVNLEAKEVFP